MSLSDKPNGLSDGDFALGDGCCAFGRCMSAFSAAVSLVAVRTLSGPSLDVLRDFFNCRSSSVTFCRRLCPRSARSRQTMKHLQSCWCPLEARIDHTNQGSPHTSSTWPRKAFTRVAAQLKASADQRLGWAHWSSNLDLLAFCASFDRSSSRHRGSLAYEVPLTGLWRLEKSILSEETRAKVPRTEGRNSESAHANSSMSMKMSRSHS